MNFPGIGRSHLLELTYNQQLLQVVEAGVTVAEAEEGEMPHPVANKIKISVLAVRDSNHGKRITTENAGMIRKWLEAECLNRVCQFLINLFFTLL